ncbi:hypothetical protein BOX15_Mlig008869g1 [Macrostomum lignano]|uniref:G-protein coupled receptors family 1 profile domain-containing protein n=1 Tax=Macrostomum lignano TaxID=282301 RepID=A0A267GK27_9PLAT|nr:hypothetical protein BOX15_Mlig008869g1 [Macrostomum lignano]
MEGTMFFTLRQANCTPEFRRAAYNPSDTVRVTIYSLTVLQAAILPVGAALNIACFATLLRYPLGAEVNGHFVSFSVCDTAFLLFNLLDTISHCVENSTPLTDGPEPFNYIAYVHPIAWTLRSVVYTAHSWQTVLLSGLKWLRICRPLSALPESRIRHLIGLVWLYSLVTSIPPILLFQAFVTVLYANCHDQGFRVAGSGYHRLYSIDNSGDVGGGIIPPAIPPSFVAVNASLLPALICLICSLGIVWRLRHPVLHHLPRRRHLRRQENNFLDPGAARLGREATRAVLMSANSFLLFQIPMVIWTLVDTWYWKLLQPAVFSMLVVVSNTISQAFFAVDLSVCLHSNHQFSSNLRRYLQPFCQCRKHFKQQKQQQKPCNKQFELRRLRGFSDCNGVEEQAGTFSICSSTLI